MLKRAQRIRSQEDLVLPLYEPLAKRAGEGDFRAPFLSVVAALAVVSNDTLWEKLTFITHLFDLNGNKVGRQHTCNMTILAFRQLTPYHALILLRGTRRAALLTTSLPLFVSPVFIRRYSSWIRTRCAHYWRL